MEAVLIETAADSMTFQVPAAYAERRTVKPATNKQGCPKSDKFKRLFKSYTNYSSFLDLNHRLMLVCSSYHKRRITEEEAIAAEAEASAETELGQESSWHWQDPGSYSAGQLYVLLIDNEHNLCVASHVNAQQRPTWMRMNGLSASARSMPLTTPRGIATQGTGYVTG